MRAAMVLSMACCCTLFTALAAGQQFPYTATVAAGAPYYGQTKADGLPAGQLPAGATVEVYRHDGDWLAIRPPEGSFSWVNTRDVAPTGQAGVVRVAAAGTISWVGHAGSENRTISQVQLKPGELLQVQGESLVGDQTQIHQWTKIAPPSGEFRFLHKRHLSAPAAAAGEGVAAAAASWSARQASATLAAAAPQTNLPTAVMSAATPLPALPAAVMPASSAPAVQQRLAQIDQQLAAMLAHPPNMWNPMAVAGELQTLSATAPTAELRAQAQTLWQRAIKSQQVRQGYAQVAAGYQTSVQPAAAVAPLRVQQAAQSQQLQLQQPQPQRPYAGGYYAAAPVPYNSGQLYISPEFRPLAPRNLLARAKAAAANMTAATRPGGPIAQYGRLEPAGAAGAQAPEGGQPQVIVSPTDENGYAGTGWLMPLVARSNMPRDSRAGVPPLALTDDEGNVKFLVTPSTGISLREYLRKEVGLIGPVTSLPNIATPHIIAQRAVVLKRQE